MGTSPRMLGTRHRRLPLATAPAQGGPGSPIVEADGVSRSFAGNQALAGVSLRVESGEICGLIGPNGAGKTTLLRILTGLLDPTSGSVRILGQEPTRAARALRQRIGLVPSGDRSFYLRISGLENLVFFARMHGMKRKAAAAQAHRVLGEVDLLDAQHRVVGAYSHGMQKRLSVARALLTHPDVLLVDEATHDLDPAGARRVRELVAEIAAQGAAVVWATQRLDELRGFSDHVTLLADGEVRFAGTVRELLARSLPRRYVLRLRNGGLRGEALTGVADRLLRGRGTLKTLGDGDSADYVLSLEENAVLGDVLAALAGARMDVLACQEERSELEEAFLALTRDAGGTQP
jgi:ABC-type multidrug transport system ATPase subunit